MEDNRRRVNKFPKLLLKSKLSDYNPHFKNKTDRIIMIKAVTTIMVINFLSEKLFIVIRFSDVRSKLIKRR
jgi:hypothetical protein